MLSPGFSVAWYLPRRSTTYSCPWGTMQTPRASVTRTANTRIARTTTVPLMDSSLLLHPEKLPFHVHHPHPVALAQRLVGHEGPLVVAAKRHLEAYLPLVVRRGHARGDHPHGA